MHFVYFFTSALLFVQLQAKPHTKRSIPKKPIQDIFDKLQQLKDNTLRNIDAIIEQLVEFEIGQENAENNKNSAPEISIFARRAPGALVKHINQKLMTKPDFMESTEFSTSISSDYLSETTTSTEMTTESTTIITSDLPFENIKLKNDHHGASNLNDIGIDGLTSTAYTSNLEPSTSTEFLEFEVISEELESTTAPKTTSTNFWHKKK